MLPSCLGAECGLATDWLNLNPLTRILDLKIKNYPPRPRRTLHPLVGGGGGGVGGGRRVGGILLLLRAEIFSQFLEEIFQGVIFLSISLTHTYTHPRTHTCTHTHMYTYAHAHNTHEHTQFHPPLQFPLTRLLHVTALLPCTASMVVHLPQTPGSKMAYLSPKSRVLHPYIWYTLALATQE